MVCRVPYGCALSRFHFYREDDPTFGSRFCICYLLLQVELEVPKAKQEGAYHKIKYLLYDPLVYVLIPDLDGT